MKALPVLAENPLKTEIKHPPACATPHENQHQPQIPHQPPAQMPDPHKRENPGRYGRAATGHQITISRRSVPTKTRTFLPQPKEMPETRLRINTVNAILKP